MAAGEDPSREQRPSQPDDPHPADAVGERASLGQGHAWETQTVAGDGARLIAWGDLAVRPARTLRWEVPRVSRRPDWRKTLADWRRTGGKGFRVRYRPQRMRPPRLVVFWDVSGSMQEFVPLYWGWLRRVRSTLPDMRVFPFGTTIVEITASLDLPESLAGPLLTQLGDVWGAGTTIGESLSRWLHRWGRVIRLTGTWIWVISDGFDRGPPEELKLVLRRLRRDDSRIWWLNPYAGTAGFSPRTRALVAAAPYLERMVPAGTAFELDEVFQYLG